MVIFFTKFIIVIKRIPILSKELLEISERNPQNEKEEYFLTKVEKMGHLLSKY